ncbi:uncharacterized protein LOC135838690 [Planococcus citri]|uniref:uncharacterized protein LOC135838690 n=1 Tax=Planococcus citri TaxID=170843 RepID=UPI0031F84637
MMTVSLFRNILLREARSSCLTCRTIIPRREKSENTSDVAPFKDDEDLNPNAPVRFSTSRASKWKVQYKAMINDPESLENQDQAFRHFMYYFSISGLVIYALLRGRNEWDDEQDVPLGKRILMLREYQMHNELQSALTNREDTSEIKLELDKIEKMKNEYYEK